ncbi:MAG: hypothetical protein J6V23_08890 [Bacteroidaceae bacterium]|jgi:hypothetical protein|nr:hypothetical protein [Bacteroidaceae bacterium]
MIDTTALTALITAFRAEVTQNSISPEKVGGYYSGLQIYSLQLHPTVV